MVRILPVKIRWRQGRVSALVPLAVSNFLICSQFGGPANVLAQTAPRATGTQSLSSGNSPKIDVLQMRSQFGNRVPGFNQSAQVPPGFPVEVYSFNALSANFSQSTTGKTAMSGTIMTKDAPQQPYQWYRNYFSQHGWTIVPPVGKLTPLEQQGKLFMIVANKDKLSVTVACLKTDKNPFTVVNISSFPSGK